MTPDTNTRTLRVISSANMPNIQLAENQCIIVAEDRNEVGESLFLFALSTKVSIQAITLILGKLVSVNETEYGHRFVIEFGQAAIPNKIDGRYEYELTPSQK
ncbi:MAG: hypothetical protein AAFN51_07975 [Pseudomonadota bacterium]